MSENSIVKQIDIRDLYVVGMQSTGEIGKLIGVTRSTVRKRLVKMGVPLRTASEAAQLGLATGRRDPLRGEKASNWNGGVRQNAGYIMVRDPHGRTKSGYMMEHRLIMEQHLGQLLQPDEHVHHKNENRSDNRLENLAVMSRSEHLRMHVTERWQDGRMENTCKPRGPRAR